MFRIIFLHIFFIVFIGNSLFAINKKREKEISIAKNLEYIADSLLIEKEYSDATDKFYSAAIIFEKNKLWIDAVKNYRQTSWCYFNLRKVDSAQYFSNYSYELLIQKIKIFNVPEKLEESEIYYTQARIYLHKKEFDSTFHYLEKGLKIINDLNLKSNSFNLLIAKYYQTFGTTNYFKGDYDASLKYNFKALNIRQNELEQTHHDIITSYYNIALVYNVKKDYKKASQYFLYITNNSTIETRILEALSYNNLGIISQNTDEYSKSIEYYNKAIDVFNAEEGENSLRSAQTMNNLGKVYYELGDFEVAFKNIKTSINIRKKYLGENHPIVSKSLLSLGQYHYKIKEYKEAIEVYIEALEIIDTNKSSDKLLKNQLYNLIGETYLQLNRNYDAIKYFQKAMCKIIDGLDYNVKLNDPKIFYPKTNIIYKNIEILSKPILYDNLINKANANFQIYKQDNSQTEKLEQSFNTFQLAFKLLDVIRLEISDDKSKFILSEHEKEYYNKAINVSLMLDSLFPEKQYLKYTLEFVDKCKSSSLRDKSYIINALNNSNIPKELIVKEKELAKELAFYNTQINKNNRDLESKIIKDYKKSYNTLAIEYDTICNYFEKTYPKYYDLIHFNELNIDKIKSELKEDELIIEYFVTDTNILIITVNNKDYEIANVNIDSTFKENVFKYYRSIRKVEISNYHKSNSLLYEKLIEPIKDRIKTKNSLILIPDDYLYFIPFETIYDNKNITDINDFRNLNYLIKNYEIRYNYSLNFWMFQKNISKTEENFIGDFIGFAPVFNDANDIPIVENYGDTTTRSVVIDGKRFSKLIYSEKEISEISKLFIKRNKTARTFIYNCATEENFKNNANGYKYIHISTHGFSNKSNPNMSGLAFYHSNNIKDSIKVEDGLLYSSEISSFDLNADLLVLSACKTGIGKLVKGEGLIALPRGFINSGIPNIVYSLWNVTDKNTSELMIEFYKEVLSDQSYSKSLREVKLKMIEDINTSYPKNWSSFVLIGF